MTDFPINSRFTFTTPQGVISDTGRELIQRYIQEQAYNFEDWKAANPDTTESYIQPLPYGWKWVWLATEKGDYVGTFPKRAGKYWYVTQSLKAPTKFLTELGNLAKMHSMDTETYEIEIVDSIDWYAGKFGDHGSCYWNDRSAAKTLLTLNGGFAVCIYEDGTPKARAWFVPTDEFFIVFNGYGFQGNPTLRIAQVMAQYFGLTYKKIDLVNNGEESGLLYINSGIGYVIGTAEHTKDIASYDLEMDGDFPSCARCDSYVDENDTHYTPNDETYCRDCFDEQCGYCAECDNTHWNHDLTEVDCDSYCERCLNKNFTRCGGCLEYFSHDDVTTFGDRTFCETCRDECFEVCEKCSEWKDTNLFVNETDDSRICKECAESAEE